MLRRNIIVLGLALLLFLPAGEANGQTSADEDLDLVNALVFMVANDDQTSGPLEAGDLMAIRDYVTDYYDSCIASARDAGDDYQFLVSHWETEKQTALDTFDPKISLAIQRHYEPKRAWLDFVMDFFRPFTTAPGENDLYLQPGLVGTITDGAGAASQMNPSQGSDLDAAASTLQSYQAQVLGPSRSAAVVDTYVVQDIAKLPDTSAVINSFSDGSYIYPSGVDVSLAGDPGQDLGQETSGQPDQREGDQGSANGQGQSGASDVQSRPVRFDNTGSQAVTVLVDSYQGEGSYPAGASTVIFPESSSAAYLELPLGKYHFCYYWETGEDSDGDGYVDYRHARSGSVSLTANSPADPGLAQTVTVSSESSAAASGKCGGEAVLVQNGLTPEESLSQGTHLYDAACTWSDGDETLVQIDFNVAYNDRGAVFTSAGESTPYDRIGVNTYQNFTGEILTVITMQESGFLVQGEGYGYQVSCDFQRVD